MRHVKTYVTKNKLINGENFIIEGACFIHFLKTLTFDEQLDSFRLPQDQYEALLEITELPEGRVYVVRHHNHLIGYVTYHYPDEFRKMVKRTLTLSD